MISVFGWHDSNTGFDQSEHALYTCYFITCAVNTDAWIIWRANWEFNPMTTDGSKTWSLFFVFFFVFWCCSCQKTSTDCLSKQKNWNLRETGAPGEKPSWHYSPCKTCMKVRSRYRRYRYLIICHIKLPVRSFT